MILYSMIVLPANDRDYLATLLQHALEHLEKNKDTIGPEKHSDHLAYLKRIYGAVVGS